LVLIWEWFYSSVNGLDIVLNKLTCSTDSLCRRQSQQSFSILTRLISFFYSLHVSAPTGHPQVRYIIIISVFLKGYFNAYM
jgi:hypothetical protein